MDYTLSTTWTVIIIVLAVWELLWKTIALWKAARNNQRAWFVSIIVVNSVGILPIIYLLVNKSRNSGSN